jgi:phosphoribosyl 1,2-cyclic phosphate phosphodiesterase
MDDEDAQNYLFDDGTCALVYATDTGYWKEETWEFLSGRKLDGLVIEATEGFVRSDYFGHMGVMDVIEVASRLRESGVLKPDSQVVSTHHSHNGDALHHELEAAFAAHNIQVGYDGLVVEV